MSEWHAFLLAAQISFTEGIFYNRSQDLATASLNSKQSTEREVFYISQLENTLRPELIEMLNQEKKLQLSELS